MPRHALILCGLAGLAAASCAQAQQVVVAGNEQQRAVDCNGGEAVLRGNNNDVQFRGACRSVTAEGNGNRVRAEIVQDAPVTVRGNDNRVRYHMLGAAHATQTQVAGNGNDVGPGAGPLPDMPKPPRPAEAALLLREENAHRDLVCAGRDVLLEGNGNQYELRGGCRSLTLRGEGVSVRAEMQPGGAIQVAGNGNAVSWSLAGEGASPVVSVNGEGSRVVPGDKLPPAPPRAAAVVTPPPAPMAPRPAAPPPASTSAAPAAGTPAKPAPAPAKPVQTGTLVVRGDHEARDIDCNGRDVKVDGNYGLYVLRGACRSVAVTGSSNKLQAEVAPGARISIDGTATTLAYVVVGDGADAQVKAKGEGSRAWRIPHLGAQVEDKPGAKAP